MGTVSNSLSSAANSLVTTSASGTGSTFMGSSTYSQDFQNVINRSVAIASLPIQLLTSEQTSLTAQSTDLTNLDSQFTKLQTAVAGIGSALGGANFDTTISQPTAVSASISSGAVEGDYTVNVTSIGAFAKSLTNQTWNSDPDPSGKPSNYTLMVGGNNYSFTAADNSATTVAAAINSQYSNLVQALAVNVGSTATPDWRISLQSSKLGAVALDLEGPPPGLQQQQAAVNGDSTSQTAATWNSAASPSGSPTTYNLTIGSNSYAITSADNNIQTVVDAINNSKYGAQVHAAVVNVAAGGAPADNRIQLTSLTSGSATLDLQRMPDGLQQQEAPSNGFAVSQTASSWDSTASLGGGPNTYNLVIGSNNYTVTPAANDAQSVAQAINTQYGSLVNALVVSGPAGDPRIQLTSAVAGTMTLDLQKSVSLQNKQVDGSLASYEILNSGKTVSSDSRTVTIAQGVSLNLLAASSGPLDVTVTRSTAALGDALSAFADAYNATFDLVNAQHGQSAGSLQGQSILSTLSRTLSSISTYNSSSGSVGGLESLGLGLGTDGHITYNALSLISADFANSTGITSFLGSATGSGFLKTATDALNNLETPITGLLKNSETDLQSRLSSLATNISDRQAKVQQLQLNLQNQMAVADALIASMQQQSNYLTSMFAAQQTADQMFK